MSPPLSTSPLQAPTADARQTRTRRLRLVRLMVLLLVAAALGPCLYIETPREVARWYLAAGYEDREAGHKQLGYDRLARAVSWSPSDAALYLERAQWREQDGQLEHALADYHRADEVAPDHFRILFARSLLLQKMGRHEDALADWKAIDRISETRGLSSREREAALLAIQEDRDAGRKKQADERLELLIGWSHDAPELARQRIRWQMEDDDYEAALKSCEALIDKEGPDYPSLYLRSQVLQHLDRHQEAIDDWEAIDRLSQDDKLPDRGTVLNGLAYARAVGNLKIEKGLKEIGEALELSPDNPAFLDTRGFLLYRQEKYEAALADLDPAVAGMEAEYQRRIASDERGLGPLPGETRTEEMKLGVAVIRYHRALVLEKLGRTEDAQADLTRARDLIGREPDETLF